MRQGKTSKCVFYVTWIAEWSILHQSLMSCLARKLWPAPRTRYPFCLMLLRKAIETSPDPRLLLRENLKKGFRAGSSAGVFFLFLYYGASKLMFFFSTRASVPKKDVYSGHSVVGATRKNCYSTDWFAFHYVTKRWIKGLVSVPCRRGWAFKRTKFLLRKIGLSLVAAHARSSPSIRRGVSGITMQVMRLLPPLP